MRDLDTELVDPNDGAGPHASAVDSAGVERALDAARWWAECRSRLAVLPRRSESVRPDRLRAALAAVVPEAVRGELIIHECHPRHLRPETDGWTLMCEVVVGAPGAEGRKVFLTGRLRPDATRRLRRSTPRDPFGSPGWRCALPDLGIELRTAPPDAALPLLGRLVVPEDARALLENAIGAGASRHAGMRIAACRPRVMRYARGSRCTVLYELDHASEGAGRGWPSVVVAKTYRDDRGRRTAEGMRALWESELAHSRAVAIAEPLAYLPDVRLLVQGPVAEERTLKKLIVSTLARRTPAAFDELDAYLARTAAGLAALHGCRVDAGEAATLEDQVAAVRTTIDRASGRIPELAGAAAPLLSRVTDLAAEHPAQAPCPSHGTFRPAQVLLHCGDVGFIDFDGFCRAEPALDVARFVAGVLDCGMRATTAKGDADADDIGAAMVVLEELCDGFLAHYEAVAPLSRARVALWQTLDLLSAVLQAWTRMSPDRLRAAMLTLEAHLDRCGLLCGPLTVSGGNGAVSPPRAA